MTEETDPDKKKDRPKFGTRSGQEDLASSLQALKDRVQGIDAGEEATPSRYTKAPAPDFKITRGYKPVMDDGGDLSSRGTSREAPINRIPAQTTIKEAEKRILLFETFSQNGIQVQTQKIALGSAKESFKNGDYARATEVAEHILENLDDSFMVQVHEETAKGMSQAYALISNARMLGIDVGEANRLMEDAQRAFLEDDYSSSNRIINSVINNLNLTKNKHLKNVVTQLLDEIKEIMDGLPVMGPQVQGVEDLYARAESLYRRGNLDEAYSVSKQAKELVQKMNDLYTQQ